MFFQIRDTMMENSARPGAPSQSRARKSRPIALKKAFSGPTLFSTSVSTRATTTSGRITGMKNRNM